MSLWCKRLVWLEGMVKTESMTSCGGIERLAYSIKEVAATLGLSENFVRSEIIQGRLLARRCGRRVLVPVEALQSYIRVSGVSA